MDEPPPQGGDAPIYFIMALVGLLCAYGASVSWKDAMRERKRNSGYERSL